MFPAAGATKLAVARYYQSIARWILPHLVDRPLTLVRCPTGVRTGVKGDDCFYLKHSKVWAPAPLRRVRIREKTKIGEYLIVDDLPGLIGLAQMDVLEIHTWNSGFADIEHPNRVVIDLDPGSEVEWKTVVESARLVRELLAAMDLETFVKTTGGRGLHVVLPIRPSADWSQCLEFARALAAALVRRQASLFTSTFAKAGRDDKILVDYLRNNRTNTSIAAYSTRARPNAPVSVPLAWTELAGRRGPERWTISTVTQRLKKLTADPWDAYWRSRQRIPAGAVRALERL